ncbi:MAG: hypothetical protein QF578_12715 [Alphaproteobacteria bacterium]|jgi:hypothetical protein|nr:hypothetical protein [Alphaproteobacteria bacterium]
MRFLIFNLVVAGALVYLVTGGDLSRVPSGGEVAGRIVGAAKGAVERGRKMAGQVADRIGQPDGAGDDAAATKTVGADKSVPPVARRKTQPPIAPRRERDLNTTVRARPAPPPPPPPVLADAKTPKPMARAKPGSKSKATPRIARVTPPLPPITDPAVLRRRAEVLAEGPIKTTVAQPRFMSPRDRRRELHALSEEMELMFARTMAR